MRSFVHMLLAVLIACCGIDAPEDNAAEADAHKLTFANLDNDRIINGQQIEITVEDGDDKVVESGDLASLSVTLARKCDSDQSYTDMATVDAIEGVATFTIEDWSNGKCAIRATADGVTEVVEEDIAVGAEPLTIEATLPESNILNIKQAFTLAITATSADGKSFAKGSSLYLTGHRHLRQFGKTVAEAVVAQGGVAHFENLYFIAPITTDIHLVVANKDGSEAGTVSLTKEIMLNPPAGQVGQAILADKARTLQLTGLLPTPTVNDVEFGYAIRNSDSADERKIFCAGEVTVAAGADAEAPSEVTVAKTTCLEKLQVSGQLFVDVLVAIDPKISTVRSTPLVVSSGS